MLPWAIPGAEFNVAIDGLSAFFLVPVFLVSLLGNIYGLGYWKQTEHPQNGRKLRVFYGTLTAGMALQLIARDGILFLFGWEIMGLSTFFLITTEGQEKDVQEAGWIYLVVTHTATLCLFAVFALLRAGSGSFLLAPLKTDALTPGDGDRDLRVVARRFRLESRHHALAHLAAQCARRRTQPCFGDHVRGQHQSRHCTASSV